MHKLILVTTLLFVLTGCALIKQGREDYQVGKDTPIAAGEVSPAEEAQSIQNLVSALPFVGPYAGTVGSILLGFFTWKRGRRIRSGMPVSTNPATGFLGKISGAEGLIQEAANIFKGVYEVGADNSALKRGWKVGLSTALGMATLALMFPAVREFIVGHPDITAMISGLSGLFGALEKKLSIVNPVAEEPK